jgi:hypothetical protein
MSRLVAHDCELQPNSAFELPVMPNARARVRSDGHCAQTARVGALRPAAQHAP